MLEHHDVQPTVDLSGLPAFRVGRDADGRWLAVETHGWAGGLFLTEAAATRYARFETDHRPGAVQPAEDLLTLRL